MKRRIGAIVASLCLILCLVLPINVFAQDYDLSYNFYQDYTISSYNIDVTVNKDNTLSVTESITALFNTQKHGIYRYIPIVNNVRQDDGSYKKVHCRVKDLQVDSEYDAYKDGDNYVIQIGDPDRTITGEKSYTISYVFDMGRDINDCFDALYYNLIGTGWDTTISDVTFSITMPDSNFSEDKLSFYCGNYGSENSAYIEHTVNGNTITGVVNKALYPGEALTVTMFLDDGYFVFNYKEYYAKLTATVGIPLLALIIVLVLWGKFGKDKKIVDVVEFYPPENMNSAEVALWYKGVLSRENTIGLLIELANDGYIDIIEKEENGFFKGKTIEIKKAQTAYSGNDPMKKIFFDGLFKYGDVVKDDDLEDSFYTTIDKVITLTSDTKKQVFDSKSLLLRLLGWVISFASARASMKIAGSGITDTGTVIAGAVGVLIGITAFIISFFIRKRTDKGHEIKQKINGFKIFLETAEKDKLELLVNEQPNYFYNILPYAYVLGVSDEWIKRFEGIALERPHWYYGNTFSPMTMYYLMHSQIPNVARSMVSVPKNSGSTGGGFSSGGGGFSGGGFGGGGGGSW